MDDEPVIRCVVPIFISSWADLESKQVIATHPESHGVRVLDDTVMRSCELEFLYLCEWAFPSIRRRQGDILLEPAVFFSQVTPPESCSNDRSDDHTGTTHFSRLIF